MRSQQSTPHQGDDVVNEVEIRYSTDPMVTVKMALNKCNDDLLELILIDPMTEEIQAQIDELRRKIKKYGSFLEPKPVYQEQAAEGGIVSSDASTLRKSTVPTRLFSSPTQQCTLDATPSTDVGGEDGPSNTATPHDDREDGGIDCDSFYPGSMRVVNKGSFPIRFLVDDECIPIKIPKIAGNNIFYKNLHEKALEIFWPTIRTRWNAQNDKLKDDLMNT